jgi:hypothetical protein
MTSNENGDTTTPRRVKKLKTAFPQRLRLRYHPLHVLISPSLCPILTDLPPYTFFLLNGDMELYRNRHFFV